MRSPKSFGCIRVAESPWSVTARMYSWHWGTSLRPNHKGRSLLKRSVPLVFRCLWTFLDLSVKTSFTVVSRTPVRTCYPRATCMYVALSQWLPGVQILWNSDMLPFTEEDMCMDVHHEWSTWATCVLVGWETLDLHRIIMLSGWLFSTNQTDCAVDCLGWNFHALHAMWTHRKEPPIEVDPVSQLLMFRISIWTWTSWKATCLRAKIVDQQTLYLL